MRELKTQYRDISAMAPISVCRGITPLCAPIPQPEDDFAAEVGGRYSERVYSLWQRLNLFFLEETAGEPVVPEKKVTLINQFTQQLFLQLFSNKQTSKLIREDRAYSALSNSLKQGRRTAGAGRSVSASVAASVAQDIAAAFREKQILTGELCGLASVLGGRVEHEDAHTASEQILLVTVNRLVKIISEELATKKTVSEQNRVLLERIRTAVESAPRGEQDLGTRDARDTRDTRDARDTRDTRMNRQLSAVVGKLLQLPAATSAADAERIAAEGRRMLDELPFTHTRAREEYVGAVERVMGMVREQKSSSEIREVVNTITNRIYERRVTSAGYGRNQLETAKRVRDLLETVVTTDPMQDSRPASRGAESRALTQLLTREALPLTASADLADERPTGGVITAESLQMDQALRTADEVVRQILRITEASEREATVMAGTMIGQVSDSVTVPMVGQAAVQTPPESIVSDPIGGPTTGPTYGPAIGHVIPDRLPASYAEGMPPVRLTYNEEAATAPAESVYPRAPEGRAEEHRRSPLQTADRMAEQITERLAEGITERVTDRFVDRLTENLTERQNHRITERLTRRFTEQVAENESYRLRGRVVDAAAEPRGLPTAKPNMVQRLHQRAQRYVTEPSVSESRHGATASQVSPIPAEAHVSPTAAWSSPTARYLEAAMTALPRTEGLGVRYDGTRNTYIYNFAPAVPATAATATDVTPKMGATPAAVTASAAYGQMPASSGSNPIARVQPFVGTPLYLQRTDNLFIYAPNGADEPTAEQSLPAEQTAVRLTEQIVGRTAERSLERSIEHVTDRVTDRVTNRVTDQVTNRVTNHVTSQVTNHMTERFAERVEERLAEHTVRQVRHHKVDMVQQLYRRTKRYLSDAVVFESQHGMGYHLSSGHASAESFLPLLNAERSTAERLFRGLPAVWMADDAAPSSSALGADSVTVPAAYPVADDTADPAKSPVGEIRPFAGTPLHLQSSGQTFIYAENATQADGTAPAGAAFGRDGIHGQAFRTNASMPVQGTSNPVGQTSPRLRGRILPDVSGYGSTLRLVIPQSAPEEALGTGRATAGTTPYGERLHTEWLNAERIRGDLPNGSYRKDLDDKTLRALDSLIAQAQGKEVRPESASPRSETSRGIARVAPVSYGSDPTLYYPEEAPVRPTAASEAGIVGTPPLSGRGISVLRPRTRAMASDVSEMRMMLRQLDNTARVKKFSSMTGETPPHISHLIHAVEAGEGSTPTGKAEKPTTLGGGVTFRTVDDSDNMIMLVPPVTADSFRAETGRLRDMPPIAHKEPHREETPPPSTSEKVTLNEKMESSRTVKTQVSKGFEDMSREDIAKLADKVYAQLEARLTRERRRSGF